MSRIVKRNSYQPTQRIEGETIDLDSSCSIQAAIKGRHIRNILNNDFSQIQAMQAAAGVFASKKNEAPIVVDTKTVYVLKGKSKTPMELEDSVLVNRLLDDGYTLIDTKRIDVMG